MRTGAGDTAAFGLDPGWHHSQNELTFANSYKMKLSIIVGVLQMLLGLMCSLLNALHFRDELTSGASLCRRCRPPPEAVPRLSPPHPLHVHPPSAQLIFLLSIFGYLVFCIFYKWSVAGSPTAMAPSLITMLIQMFMRPGVVPAEAHLFRGQATVQLLLLALAFVCVPWIPREAAHHAPAATPPEVQVFADAATLGRGAAATATPTAAARRSG